jgi:hypothetical protein
MASFLLFFFQIGLALYTILILGLILIYLIKNLIYREAIISLPEKELHEKQLAIVFYNFANEKEIVARIQELQNQNYFNYTAYFFIKTQIIETNNLKNIKIIRPIQSQLTGLNFLEIVKPYLEKTPDAVIAIKSDSCIPKDYLNCMNLNLMQGKKVVQSQVIIDGNNESLGVYQKFAREVLNLIDREAPNALGISAAIWEQGFMLQYQIFKEINFQLIAGNDKLLQAEIIIRSIKIDYDATARILGKTLKKEHYKIKKQLHLRMYFHNIQLGFKLLKEGIKYPNIDKIVFGMNYLRPPVYIALASSLLLFFLNVLQDEKTSIFNLIAGFGILSCILVLLKGQTFINIANHINNSNNSFGLNQKRHDHKGSFINYPDQKLHKNLG